VAEHAGRTFGPDDFGGSRPKQLLEIMVAARGRRVPVDRVAELLWQSAGRKASAKTRSSPVTDRAQT
jgi:hypothetical protein